MKKTLLSLAIVGLVSLTSCDKAKEGANAVADTAVNATETVVDGTVDAVGTVAEGTADAAGAVVDGTTNAVGTVAEGTANAAGAVVDGAKKLLGFDLPTFEGNENLNSFVTEVKEITAAAQEAVASKDVAKITELVGKVGELKTKAQNLASGLTGETSTEFNGFAKTAITAISNLLGSAGK